MVLKDMSWSQSLEPVTVTIYGKVFPIVIKDFEIMPVYLDGS